MNEESTTSNSEKLFGAISKFIPSNVDDSSSSGTPNIVSSQSMLGQAPVASTSTSASTSSSIEHQVPSTSNSVTASQAGHKRSRESTECMSDSSDHDQKKARTQIGLMSAKPIEPVASASAAAKAKDPQIVVDEVKGMLK